MLMTIDEAAQKIRSHQVLSIAGDEAALRQLPRGSWVAGTIPYFIGENGGIFSKDRVFVTELPADLFSGIVIKSYSETQIAEIATEAPDNGLTFLIIPSGSAVHQTYAQNAPDYKDLFLKPLVGWIAGVALDEIGKKKALVFNGQTGEVSTSEAVALHGTLAPDRSAQIGIANIFEPGNGDLIEFETDGFSVKDCLINGHKENFAGYLERKGVDTQLPLVADYNGALVNVSFQSVDRPSGTVHLFAPVFRYVQYRLARPVGDYEKAFEKAIQGLQDRNLAFSCNCILNYLYGQLEGKKTGKITGPVTFGEIAYQLLNQTLVYVEV